ncbi:hypothetical protein BC829DRAFT_176280 [Chytridium lagenaria]|nr:hypothetical protein BC829DRAFT_176280 [Chytridium lagenaria]
MGKPDDAVADVDGFFRSVKEDTAFGVVDGAYNVCGCKSPCVDESGGVLVQIWALAYRTFCPESGISVQTSKNFVVSSKRVRSLPLKTYKYLYTYTAISDYQVIPKDSKLITTSEVIDMSWPVIFRCAHSRMAETCHMGGKCSCSDGEA